MGDMDAGQAHIDHAEHIERPDSALERTAAPVVGLPATPRRIEVSPSDISRLTRDAVIAPPDGDDPDAATA